MIERPADDWQNYGLDPHDTPHFDTVIEKLKEVFSSQAVARSECAFSISTTHAAFEESIDNVDAETHGHDTQNDKHVLNYTA